MNKSPQKILLMDIVGRNDKIKPYKNLDNQSNYL